MTFFPACSFGLPERSTDNSTGGVHRIHTRSVHHEHYSLPTSTNMKCVRLKHELQRHLCTHEKSLSSGQPCHLLAGLCLNFSLPIHHNTKHHLDSTTFSKTTLYTEHLCQNQYNRQAALKNRSRTSITRVAETRAAPLTQYSHSCDRSHNFTDLLHDLRNILRRHTVHPRGVPASAIKTVDFRQAARNALRSAHPRSVHVAEVVSEALVSEVSAPASHRLDAVTEDHHSCVDVR